MVKRMNNEKNRKILFFCLIAVLLTVFQTVLSGAMMINGTTPDLFFVFILVYACINRNFREVITVSIIFGAISDFLCHSVFLGCTAMYTYSAAIGYYLKNLFIKPNVIFLSVIALVVFIVGKTIIYPVLWFTAEVGFSDYFVKDIVPSCFYNAICFFVTEAILLIAEKKGVRKNAI